MTDASAAAVATEYRSSRLPEIEAALARAVDAIEQEVGEAVAPAVRHAVMGGGKRLRPILCVAAYEACGGPATDEVYDVAAAVELVHAYSLVHDDLPCMDDAPLRRGRPTTHAAHGERVATLAGLALVPAAGFWAVRSTRELGLAADAVRALVVELLGAAGAGGMVGGQWLDLLGEHQRLDEDALTALHRRKTGALITASLTIGGRAAGAAEPVRLALEEYGRRIGLAFQIADDVLDATRSAEELGKQPSDEALGKSTYVELHGVEGARALARIEIEAAEQALKGAGVASEPLVALARYVVARDR